MPSATSRQTSRKGSEQGRQTLRSRLSACRPRPPRKLMAYRRVTSAAHREMPRSVLGLAARMGTRRGGRCPQPARHARIGPAATKRCSSPCSSRDGRSPRRWSAGWHGRPCWQEPDKRGEDFAVGPVEPGPGLERRSTATSCRCTSSSACVEADDRPSRTSQPRARRATRPRRTTTRPKRRKSCLAPGSSQSWAMDTPNWPIRAPAHTTSSPPTSSTGCSPARAPPVRRMCHHFTR